MQQSGATNVALLLLARLFDAQKFAGARFTSL